MVGNVTVKEGKRVLAGGHDLISLNVFFELILP